MVNKTCLYHPYLIFFNSSGKILGEKKEFQSKIFTEVSRLARWIVDRVTD